MGAALKPVLFVTNHAPPDRIGAFAALHEREDVVFALFGGRLAHGSPPGAGQGELPFPHRRIEERQAYAMAARGGFRAVVCGTAGRLALPGAWAGARRARVPLLLWSALWAHPRSLAHLASRVALVRLYRSADAVVVYGPHVERYVRAHGARNVHVAPQAVDNAFWAAPAASPPAAAWPAQAETRYLFVGRDVREKGLRVLLEAWRASGLRQPQAALVLVGAGPSLPWASAGGAVALPESRTGSGRAFQLGPTSLTAFDPVDALRLRNFYSAAHVLVMPSIATPKFREPWGLVANEAMNQRTAVIATDAVGAAAGGLVRDGRNGLIVPGGDAGALERALRRLAGDRQLRERYAAAAVVDVGAYTYAAWAEGFSAALHSVGASRGASG